MKFSLIGEVDLFNVHCDRIITLEENTLLDLLIVDGGILCFGSWVSFAFLVTSHGACSVREVILCRKHKLFSFCSLFYTISTETSDTDWCSLDYLVSLFCWVMSVWSVFRTNYCKLRVMYMSKAAQIRTFWCFQCLCWLESQISMWLLGLSTCLNNDSLPRWKIKQDIILCGS